MKVGRIKDPLYKDSLGAEYPSPKKVNLSTMVGLYKPQKVKGYP